VPGYFLDTSAFAKLYHQEAGSDFVEHIVSVSGSALVSRLSVIEIESVFAIHVWTGQLDLPRQDLARRRLRADIAQGRIRVGPPIEESLSARPPIAGPIRRYDGTSNLGRYTTHGCAGSPANWEDLRYGRRRSATVPSCGGSRLSDDQSGQSECAQALRSFVKCDCVVCRLLRVWHPRVFALVAR